MNIVKRVFAGIAAVIGIGVLGACSGNDPDVNYYNFSDDTLKAEAIKRIEDRGADQLKNEMKFESVGKGTVLFDKSATFTAGYNGCSVSLLRTPEGNIAVLVPYTKDSNLLVTDLDDDPQARDLWNAVLIKSAADLETHKDLKDREEFKNCKAPSTSSTTASQTTSTQPTN